MGLPIRVVLPVRPDRLVGCHRCATIDLTTAHSVLQRKQSAVSCACPDDRGSSLVRPISSDQPDQTKALAATVEMAHLEENPGLTPRCQLAVAAQGRSFDERFLTCMGRQEPSFTIGRFHGVYRRRYRWRRGSGAGLLC